MKKTAVILMVMGLVFQAQAQSDKSFNQNEIKLNILNTIVQGSVEIGYEYFLDRDQSIGVEYLINDRFGYKAQGEDGRDFQTSSFLVSYNFYFINDVDPASIYVYPFLKFRFGEFVENAGPSTDMNSAIIGIGIGYKWVHNDKFVIAPYANIARGFSEEVKDRFSAVEVNAGVSIGYRF